MRSVAKALEKAGSKPVVTDDPETIAGADGLVFPGQGANDPAMRALRERNLVEPIKDFVRSGRPFLGVCLGLQLLLRSSEEGIEPCLGVFSGKVRKLPQGLKVPHIGWNQVQFYKEHEVFRGIPNGSYFYFVHSYYADPEDISLVAGVTDYGVRFCSAIAIDNVVSTQFHPEKSGDLGLKIYENFVGLVASKRVVGHWK